MGCGCHVCKRVSNGDRVVNPVEQCRPGRQDIRCGSGARRRATFDQCDVTSSAGTAIFIVGATAKPVIRNCTVRDSRDNGIFILEDGGGTIERCRVSGNGSAGVMTKSGGDPTVRECELRDNKQAGIAILESGRGHLPGARLPVSIHGLFRQGPAWSVKETVRMHDWLRRLW